MRAAVLEAFDGPHLLREVQTAPPQDDEVVIATRAVGVCHSDRHGQHGGAGGTLPLILGHEASGVVVETGARVTHVRPGDHVVVCPSGSCGRCGWCDRGLPQHCVDNGRTRSDGSPRLLLEGRPVTPFVGLGAFAETMLVSEKVVAPVPAGVPFDIAALLGCAVVTGLGAVLTTAAVRPGETVVIVGCGGVGLSAVQGARLAGAGRVIAVDRVAAKLPLATALGATDVVDASEVDPVAAVLELTGGADHVIEAVGRPATIEQAFAMLGVRGTATVVGVPSTGDTVTLPSAALLGERRLQGSRLGGTRLRVDIPRYAALYLAGRLDLDPLVSERVDLADLDAALDALDAPTGARSVVVIP